MVPTQVRDEAVSEFERLIEAHDLAGLRELTKNWRPSDLADAMEPLPGQKEATNVAGVVLRGTLL